MELGKESIDLGILVRDVDACRRFYGEQLGLPFQGELPMGGGRTMYRYLIGSTVLKLIGGAGDVPDGPGGMFVQSGLRYFTITVKDINAAAERLQAQGMTPTVSVREFRPGSWIAIFPDPDGNMVELLETRG